jgi:undecaprenyl-diphosphatase
VQIVSERMFASLDAMEVEIVARVVASAERRGLDRIARVATRLGNGWLYPILSIVLFMRPRVLFTAAISLSISFLAYPLLKKLLRRARPCDYDRSLARELEPLDHYSCPSGHAMTAAAYGVPLLFAWPAAAPFVIALCVVIGWSRVALGHHYVSDVVFGAMIGATVASAVGAIVY